MQIHNIRYGHATNSSSAHSFVLLRAPVLDEPAHGDYGWDRFILTSPEDKRHYMAVQLQSNLRRILDDASACLLAESVCDTKIEDSDYVDHQSVFELPRPPDGKGVHLDFFRELLAAVLEPNVAILGGNDNAGTEWHEPLGLTPKWASPLFNWFSGSVARKDPQYETWTLFSKRTGDKIRFSFKDQPDPGRSALPELVDLKITDHCDRGCSFCYQGSTKRGAHAHYSTIRLLIHDLKLLGVFEVALGGGEPTLHPNFADILWMCHESRITPNFSTRNLAWAKDATVREAVQKYAGAWAYSVDCAADAHRLVRTIDRYTLKKHYDTRIHIQVIPACCSFQSLERILQIAHANRIPVTLLGYKATGRGAQQPPRYQESHWVRVVQKMLDRDPWSLPKLGVDTVLAQRFQADLDRLGVPRAFYYTGEGTFSCYIDAVTERMGPSSFCAPAELVPLPKYAGGSELQRLFQSFGK